MSRGSQLILIIFGAVSGWGALAASIAPASHFVPAGIDYLSLALALGWSLHPISGGWTAFFVGLTNDLVHAHHLPTSLATFTLLSSALWGVRIILPPSFSPGSLLIFIPLGRVLDIYLSTQVLGHNFDLGFLTQTAILSFIMTGLVLIFVHILKKIRSNFRPWLRRRPSRLSL